MQVADGNVTFGPGLPGHRPLQWVVVDLVDNGLEILNEAECIHLLGTVKVGRIAITAGEIPVVLPVNFGLVGGEILFFSGSGLKLVAADERRTVSFEADDFDVAARTGWSVLVAGRLERAGDIGRSRARDLGLYPWAAGDRHALVRIRPTFWSGRRLR
jgi:uncharacterized protein